MRLLRERGYENVRHYPDGLAGWREAGAALERGRAGAPATARPGAAATATGRWVEGPDAPLPARDTAPRPPADDAAVARLGVRTAHARLSRWRGRHRPRHAPRWARALLRIAEERPIADLVVMWVAMILVCGVAYWLAGLSAAHGLMVGPQHVPFDASGLATAVYFSVVTATSVGYGDVVPLGAARVLAVAEAIAGLLAFGVVVSRFVSRRQDELVREIHRITFEERLDRVQTNLHLVLSEMQTIAGLCESPKMRAEWLAVRLESAAQVFAGELRAVHDLLYRPEHMPDAAVLEAILASLAAALHALAEVLTCLPHEISRSPALDNACATMARLAEEICGECVPYAYAPGLKAWMDRIRDAARALT